MQNRFYCTMLKKMKVLASTKICVADWYPIIKKRGRDGIPFIWFNPVPFLCFSKPEPGFPSLYYMVVFFNDLRWSVFFILLILVEFFNTKKHTIMAFDIQVLVWNKHKNVAGLNWLMGSKPSTLIIESQKTIQI